MKRSQSVLLLLLLLALGFSLGAFFLWRSNDGLKSGPVANEAAKSNAMEHVASERLHSRVSAGRPTQPATRPTQPATTPGSAPTVAPAHSAGIPVASSPDAARVVPLSPSNPQARSVIEAIETGARPERLTSAIKPKPFDKAAYEANPASYLDICEPGRVWDVADAGPHVPELERRSVGEVDMKPGTSTAIEVKALPLAPVTFTSFDWGAFENRLTSITVRADATGLARAVFTATDGTTGHVEILAACPLTSGQIKFRILIE